MLDRMTDTWLLVAQASPGIGPVDPSALPSHAELVGWAGTILSIATAFTGGFVMMYQRIQRARRDDTMEWMKLRQGSLQSLLEQANKERAEIRGEVDTLTAKLAVVTKQNAEQLQQIFELTRHISQLGVLIGRLPARLGLGLPTGETIDPTGTLGQTVACLEGLVEQLRETTDVLSSLAGPEPPDAGRHQVFGPAGGHLINNPTADSDDPPH